jgi:hypothetical protein
MHVDYVASKPSPDWKDARIHQRPIRMFRDIRPHIL